MGYIGLYAHTMALPQSFPDLLGLELFLSVVREGSVSKAAAAHQISQPSASNRIKTLERQLGVVLLDRSPSGSQPTAAGSLVAGWAERVVQAAEELDAGVRALKSDAAGELRVAASFTIAEYLLPSWLERHGRDHEGERITLTVINSTSVLEEVRAGSADVGFIESPGVVTDLDTAVVANDRLVVVVSPSHVWARKGAVSLDTLASTPLVLREVGSGTRDALAEGLSAAGYDEPLARLELGSTSAVKSAVMTGSSPGVLSLLAVQADIDSGRLAVVRVRGLRMGRELRAIWSRVRPLSSSGAELIERLAASN